MPKKKTSPPPDIEDKLEQHTAPAEQLPQAGDVIQVVSKGKPLTAHIGIVHHQEGSVLVCYAPGKGGFPNSFEVYMEDVAVVGHARLKFKGEELPRASADPGRDLDKL